MVAEWRWANVSPREGGARPWTTTVLISPCKRQIAWRDVKCGFRKVRQPGAVLMGLFVTGRFPVVLV